MKVRTSFVSNSSSMSFILVFGPDAKLPNGNLMTLEEYAQSVLDGYDGDEYEDVDDVLEREYVASEAKEHINEGERFIANRVSMHSDWEDMEFMAEKLGARAHLLPM